MTDEGVESSISTRRLTIVDALIEVKSSFFVVVYLGSFFALISLAALFIFPKNFVSVALLSVSGDNSLVAEALMRSPVALDFVSEKMPLRPGEKLPITPEARRRQLNRKFVFAAATDGPRARVPLFNLVVTDTDPTRAQLIATTLIDIWLELSKPKPDHRARLEGDLARAQAQFDTTTNLIGQLEREAKTLVSPFSLQGELASPLNNLITQRASVSRTIADLQDALRGGSRDVIVSPPTLPAESSRDRQLVSQTLTAGFAGGVLGVIFILFRFVANTFKSESKFAQRWSATRWGVFRRPRKQS